MKRRESEYRAMVPFRPFLKPITYWWLYRTTAAGKFVAIGFVVSAGMGAHSVQIPIYRLFSLLLGILSVAWAVGFLMRARLSVSGGLPARAAVGQAVRGDFTLTNVSRSSVRDLSAGFFRLSPSLRESRSDDLVPQLGPGQSARLAVELTPWKRGSYVLPPLCAFTTFPFHLFRTTARTNAQEASLLVLPWFHPVSDIHVPLGRRYQPGGVSLTSNIGESPEYIGNREYRPGDPIRRMDHRSWGRLGKPVVREYQEEYYCRIALILDTFVPPASRNAAGSRALRGRWSALALSPPGAGPPEGYPELEAAISLSASVADILSRGEYLIDIFAAGPELYTFRAGRHIAHFDNILEILSCLDACKDNPFTTLAPALSDELESISTAICVFLDWDTTRQEFARRIAESGCSLKVLVVCQGGSAAAEAKGWGIPDGSWSVFSPEEIRSGGIETL